MRLPVLAILGITCLPNVASAQGYAPVDPCDADPKAEGCDQKSKSKGDDAGDDAADGKSGDDEATDESDDRASRRSRSSDGSSGGKSSGDDLIPPATDPWFFVGAVGPTFFGINGGRTLRRQGGVNARGKVGLDLGYHLDGSFEGPAIGLSIEQTFNDQFYVFNPAFKFWWDIQPIEEYGIYITPFAKAGYALRAACAGCPEHGANIGLGAEGRVVFQDRWIALLRPFQLDTYLGNFFEEVFWLNYTAMIGGGLTF